MSTNSLVRFIPSPFPLPLRRSPILGLFGVIGQGERIKVRVRFVLSAVICVCLFCVLCGLLSTRYSLLPTLHAEEVDVKTKIKEWFGILTIPSEVEGLKHKDPAVRMQAVEHLGKAKKSKGETKWIV